MENNFLGLRFLNSSIFLIKNNKHYMWIRNGWNKIIQIDSYSLLTDLSWTMQHMTIRIHVCVFYLVKAINWKEKIQKLDLLLEYYRQWKLYLFYYRTNTHIFQKIIFYSLKIADYESAVISNIIFVYAIIMLPFSVEHGSNTQSYMKSKHFLKTIIKQ